MEGHFCVKGKNLWVKILKFINFWIFPPLCTVFHRKTHLPLLFDVSCTNCNGYMHNTLPIAPTVSCWNGKKSRKINDSLPRRRWCDISRCAIAKILFYFQFGIDLEAIKFIPLTGNFSLSAPPMLGGFVMIIFPPFANVLFFSSGVHIWAEIMWSRQCGKS